jgi:hypothetical protein
MRSYILFMGWLATVSRSKICLAMLRSRQAVKEEMRKLGIKPTQYSAAEITSWAHVFLDDHHETLIPDTIEEARRMILSGVLGKRAQRARRNQSLRLFKC